MKQFGKILKFELKGYLKNKVFVGVTIFLVNRANTDGQCWPSVRRIAKDLSLSPSTVKRAIDDLTLHGYIKIEQRFRKSGAKSSLMFTVPDFSKYRTPKG